MRPDDKMAASASQQEEEEELPLSFAQERLWFQERMQPGTSTYHVAATVRLNGRLAAAAFRAALDEVVRRHESLRTGFGERGGRPSQSVAPAAAFPLLAVDLRSLAGAALAREIAAQTTAASRRPFDLSRAPLGRAALLRVGDEEHILAFVLHHLITDGWSSGVLVRELAVLYAAFVEGRPSPLPELPVQYADYAIWQREWLTGEVLESQLAYWRGQLAGAPPVLDLPTDRPRPPLQRFHGSQQSWQVPGELLAGLRIQARLVGATLFMSVLAVFAALLARYAGRDDLVVGTPIAGRNRHEVEGLIGFFVNTLVLRTDLSGDPSFGELLDRVRLTALAAYAHQDVPFEKLVEELRPERSLAYSPLFQVHLVVENSAAGEPAELPGLTVAPVAQQTGVAKFDLVLIATEAGTGPNSPLAMPLAMQWRFDTELFDETTISRMSGHFLTLVGSVAADPERPVGELPILTAAERQAVQAEWSGAAAVPAAAPRTLPELFAERAAAAPGATAVLFERERMTYGDLESRSNRLARHLRAMGVGPEVLVALYLERSPELVVALLAVLKAGGAYLPLDPTYPAERLSRTLADAAVPILITEEALLDALLDHHAWAVCLEQAGPLIEMESDAPLAPGVTPDNLAYVIYTSGSTGTPKGVAVTHRGLDNLSAEQGRLFGVDPESRVLQFASLGFDASVSEIAVALRAGAVLCLAPRASMLPGFELTTLLRDRSINVVTLPPSVLAALPHGSFPALSTLVVAGEPCPVELAERWAPGRRLINAYGPTEATVCATADVYAPGSGRLPIGGPIGGAEVYVLDRRGGAVPAGIPGQLHVGGIGLARGYLGSPEQTAERFVPHPFSRRPGARLYATGDLARFLPDGRLDFLGRTDHQVKVRGFRIEPGEIEAALAAHPAVRQAAVVAREEGDDRRLIAYVAPSAEASGLGSADLRAFLGRTLPDYMVPAAVVVLPELPLNASGKVDRRALPAPDWAAAAGRERIAPRTPLESFLAGLFQETLQLEEVGIEDDFFDLGGNSIAGAVLVNRLQEELGEIVHVVVMFEAPTVAGLAAYVAEHYPSAVARLFGRDLAAGERSGETRASRVDAARLADIRRLIAPQPALPAGTAKNPTSIFVLSPPRSGSTLLRVMLAGHPGLFAPPELELLPFNTLAERRDDFPGRYNHFLEGGVRAVMELRGLEAEAAESVLDDLERQGATGQELYRLLQEWSAPRVLVDKTPGYALDVDVLRRAEKMFEAPRYIHLVRHPFGMIRSFEEAKLDQVFFRYPHDFARRELAELIWLVSQQNILAFLAEVPAERQHRLHFEELLADPEGMLRQACDFLGLEYHPDMAQPYQQKSARMTDGIHSWSRMVGDVKFHQHSGVDRSVADRWQSEYSEDFLGDVTWEAAAALGYERPAAWTPLGPMGWRPGEPLPLSFAQERLWFLQRLDPGSTAYNIPSALRLSGPLDVAALGWSLGEIVRRHAVLRTTFALADGRPAQWVAPVSDLPLPVVDLSALPAPKREAEAVRSRVAEAGRRFDLERGPVFRATLLRLGAEEHAALFTLHHVASDAWSTGILVRELAALYTAATGGEPGPLPDLAVQYADFALWQRGWLVGEVLERELAFWRESLAGAAVLELPTARPRPPVQTSRGAALPLAVPAGIAEALAALARAEGATRFMVLLASWNALFHRYTGQDDVVVGSPVANRTRREVEPLIGCFVNTLVLRADCSGDPAFRELVGRVRRTALDAYAHQEVPFEKIVEELSPVRDMSRSPLFQVLFALQNVPARALELPGLTLAPLAPRRDTAKFDLSLDLVETPLGFAGAIEYNRDLFDAATVARLAEHWGHLLQGLAAEPGLRLSELPLLTPAERLQLAEWNATDVAYPRDSCLHELIAVQAERTPEAVAVEIAGERLTYGELEARADRLAARLRELGVGPETRVGICLERSLELVVGLLGVLKAGGAYVPLAPDDPAERLAFMLADSAVPVLLTQERLAGAVPAGEARVLALDSPEPGPARWYGGRGRFYGIDDGVNPVQPGNLAYVIYTSGSTGRPKGAMNSHAGIVNRLLWKQQAYPLTPADRVLQKTPVSFDVSVWELFLPLAAGARLVLARPGGHQDPEYLAATIAEQGITVLHFVPSMLDAFLEARGLERCGSLRRVVCSGEALSQDLERRFFARLPYLPGIELLNLYGPTETAVDVTFWACERDGVRRTVPIGHPVANTRIHLLDPHLGEVPVGVAGELYIGGVQVGRGYLDRPELTAERFVPDPFSGPGMRLYRTGDLARRAGDGAVDYLGRIDHQVKVRGFRIELGEIEAALGGHPDVARALVLAREARPGDLRLVAWVVPRGEEAPPAGELRAFLAARLPGYMVPADLVPLAAVPVLPNGKVDWKALPEPGGERERRFVAPSNPVEEVLANLWREVLGRERVGAEDDFFDLGGHSLLATRVVSRIQKVFRVDVALRDFFRATTVARLAEVLVAAEAQPGQTERMARLLLQVHALSDEERHRMLADVRAEAGRTEG